MRENVVSVDSSPVWNYCDEFALEGHLFLLDFPLILSVVAVNGVESAVPKADSKIIQLQIFLIFTQFKYCIFKVEVLDPMLLNDIEHWDYLVVGDEEGGAEQADRAHDFHLIAYLVIEYFMPLIVRALDWIGHVQAQSLVPERSDYLFRVVGSNQVDLIVDDLYVYKIIVKRGACQGVVPVKVNAARLTESNSECEFIW